MSWEEEWELFCNTLNQYTLPEIKQGEEIWQYMKRVEEFFEDKTLPAPFEGDIFNFMDEVEFGDYLEKYRHIHIKEETKYTLWRK